MHRNRAISMPQRQSLRRAISEEVVPIKFPNSTVDESVHSPSPIEHLSVDGCEIMLQSQNAVMKEELRSVASNLVANERDEASVRPKPQSSSIYLSGLAPNGESATDLSQSSRSLCLTNRDAEINDDESATETDEDENDGDTDEYAGDDTNDDTDDSNIGYAYGSESDYSCLIEERIRNRRRASSTLSCFSNIPYGTDDIKWKPAIKEISRRRYLRDSLKCIKPFLDSNDCLGKVIYIPVSGPTFETSNKIHFSNRQSLQKQKNHF